MRDGAMHVLQITDCHLFPSASATLLGVETCASLDAALKAACAQRTPDAVLATGDIAQRPTAETYALFLSAVRRRYGGPLLCVPGNHDHGETFAAALPAEDLTVGAWRLVGVDTHVDGRVGGSVSEAELARLAALPAGGPTLVAGHHCPADVGSAWLDEHRIDNGAALLRALDALGAAAYAFGHIHQPFERQRSGGARLLGAPSTCFQFAPNTASFALDGAAPGFRWLRLAADGGVTSEVGRADYDIRLDLKDRDQ